MPSIEADDGTDRLQHVTPHVALEIDSGKPFPDKLKAHTPTFPPSPALKDRVKAFINSREFHAALQLMFGELVICLFVLVNKLHYSNSCLASVFYTAAVILDSKDAHVGSKMNAAAFVIGPLWFGSITAGCMISIARACQVAFTGLLCLFSVIGLLPVCLLRSTMGPGVGIFSNLGFGITVIQGQFTWQATHGYQLLWKEAVGHILMDGLVSSLGVAAGGLLALPILASDTLQAEADEVLTKLGHSLSRYATHILQPEHHSPDKVYAGDVYNASDGALPYKPASQNTYPSDVASQQEGDDYWEVTRLATDPAVDSSHQHPACASSVAKLRPLVAHCRLLLGEAQKEPPCLARHRIPLEKWPPALAAFDSLITKVAALESLLKGAHGSQLHPGRLKQLLGLDVFAALQLMYGQMAAACAHHANQLKNHPSELKSGQKYVFGLSWSALEHELAHTLHATSQGYWARWQASEQHTFTAPSPQARALLYTSTLTNAIMEAMSNMEAAFMDMLAPTPGLQKPLYNPPADVGDPKGVVEAPAPVHQALDQFSVSEKQWTQQQQYGMTPINGSSVPISGSAAGPNASADQTERQVSAPRPWHKTTGSAKRLLPVSFRHRPLQWPSQTQQPNSGKASAQASLYSQVKWVDDFVRTMLAQMCFQGLWKIVSQAVPQACSSKATLKDTVLHGRKFQFFCKYWFAMSTSLCGCILLSQDTPSIREWSPLYVMITVVVVMSEKVDTTITKALLRLVGSSFGGAIGYVVMLRTSLATSPVALAVIICAYTWLFGLAQSTPFKYAVFLTLITADAVILCQYSPVPGSAGSVKYFYGRCASIAVGVIVVLIIGLILPWFTYADALDTLGSAYKEATKLTLEIHNKFYNDVKESDSNTTAENGQVVEHFQLQQRVAAPLVRVQTALARETVLWKRGILVMPKIVTELLQAMQTLLDRVSALEMMLHQKPVVSGRYTSAPYHNVLQALEPISTAVTESTVQLGALTAELLSERCSNATLEAVQGQIQQLEHQRVELRKQYIQISHAYHLEVKSQPNKPHIKDRTVDDAVRYLSFLFAISNANDKATLLAKAACGDTWLQARCHNKLKADIQAWLGL